MCSSQLEAALNGAYACSVCKKLRGKLEFYEQPRRRKGPSESLIVSFKACKTEAEVKTNRLRLFSQPIP